MILFSASSVSGQARRFFDVLAKCPPVYYDTSATMSKEERVKVFEFDEARYSGLILSAINKRRKQRSRPGFQQDTLLNRLCVSGLQSFLRSRFKRPTTWKKEQKTILAALDIYESKFRLFAARAFSIDLIDLQKNAAFYYLKKYTASELQLYKGKQPNSTDPDVEGYEEPVPIEAATLLQLTERVLEMFPRTGNSGDLLSRKYCRIGIAIQVDRRTLYKQKRPTANLVLIIAGKKLQKVRLKDFVEEEYATEKTYE